MRLDHLQHEGGGDPGIEGVAARSSTPIPTAVAIQCVEATTPKVPSISGRVVKGSGLTKLIGNPLRGGPGAWARTAPLWSYTGSGGDEHGTIRRGRPAPDATHRGRRSLRASSVCRAVPKVYCAAARRRRDFGGLAALCPPVSRSNADRAGAVPEPAVSAEPSPASSVTGATRCGAGSSHRRHEPERCRTRHLTLDRLEERTGHVRPAVGKRYARAGRMIVECVAVIGRSPLEAEFRQSVDDRLRPDVRHARAFLCPVFRSRHDRTTLSLTIASGSMWTVTVARRRWAAVSGCTLK